jgi:hypothetical protein
VAEQVVASREELGSTELVSYSIRGVCPMRRSFEIAASGGMI